VTEQRDSGTAGDYGYDLAHEQTGRGRARDDRTGSEHHGASSSGGKVDPDQDFGYDEAHDF
jgi:hypothetical protein